MFIGVLPASTSSYHMHAIAVEARRGFWISWHCNYWQWLTVMQVLGIEPGSSRRAVNNESSFQLQGSIVHIRGKNTPRKLT